MHVHVAVVLEICKLMRISFYASLSLYNYETWGCEIRVLYILFHCLLLRSRKTDILIRYSVVVL